VAADASRGELYYASAPYSAPAAVQIWDYETFGYVAQIVRSGSTSSSFSNTARRVLRWGNTGLIVLMGSSFTSDPDVLWIIDDLTASRTQ
jgi:hypothetical protein